MKSRIFHLPCHAFVAAVILCLGIQAAPAQESDTPPMVRLICTGGLGEAKELALATKAENGKWNEISSTELRDPMVSNWLRSHPGEIHILRKNKGKPESIVHFIHEAGIRRALVVLTASEGGKNCRALVLDPEKAGFKAGTTIVFNASKANGTVSLGTETITVEAGKHHVATPVPDENGGYRVMVQSGEGDAKQVCYDRFATINPNSRTIIVLLPDPNVPLRVTSLSEFGPFE